MCFQTDKKLRLDTTTKKLIKNEITCNIENRKNMTNFNKSKPPAQRSEPNVLISSSIKTSAKRGKRTNVSANNSPASTILITPQVQRKKKSQKKFQKKLINSQISKDSGVDVSITEKSRSPKCSARNKRGKASNYKAKIQDKKQSPNLSTTNDQLYQAPCPFMNATQTTQSQIGLPPSFFQPEFLPPPNYHRQNEVQLQNPQLPTERLTLGKNYGPPQTYFRRLDVFQSNPNWPDRHKHERQSSIAYFNPNPNFNFANSNPPNSLNPMGYFRQARTLPPLGSEHMQSRNENVAQMSSPVASRSGNNKIKPGKRSSNQVLGPSNKISKLSSSRSLDTRVQYQFPKNSRRRNKNRKRPAQNRSNLSNQIDPGSETGQSENLPTVTNLLETEKPTPSTPSVETPSLSHTFPADHFWIPPMEVPERLAELNSQHIPTHEELIKMAWNENDSSQNVIVIENGYTLHRHPVAQSTDAIRGKTGYSSGMHAIEFVWEHGQRGTHAVIGLCTKEMKLERPGYCSLIGHDDKGWGWDLTRNKLFHNGSLVRPGSNLPIRSEKENGNNGNKRVPPNPNTPNEKASSQISSNTSTHSGIDPNSASAAYQALAAYAVKSHADQENLDSPIHKGDYEHYLSNENSLFDKRIAHNEDITKLILDEPTFEHMMAPNGSLPSLGGQSSSQQNSNSITNRQSNENNAGFYPNSPEEYTIPPRIVMILDCDNGWCGFCADGQWLGVAFSNLKTKIDDKGVRHLPGALYPTISCVWGNCEVSMKPLCSINAKPPSLMSLCRKSLWTAAGGPAYGLKSTDIICKFINFQEKHIGPIPARLKKYLLAPTRYTWATKIYSEFLCASGPEGERKKQKLRILAMMHEEAEAMELSLLKAKEDAKKIKTVQMKRTQSSTSQGLRSPSSFNLKTIEEVPGSASSTCKKEKLAKLDPEKALSSSTKIIKRAQQLLNIEPTGVSTTKVNTSVSLEQKSQKSSRSSTLSQAPSTFRTRKRPIIKSDKKIVGKEPKVDLSRPSQNTSKINDTVQKSSSNRPKFLAETKVTCNTSKNIISSTTTCGMRIVSSRVRVTRDGEQNHQQTHNEQEVMLQNSKTTEKNTKKSARRGQKRAREK